VLKRKSTVKKGQYRYYYLALKAGSTVIYDRERVRDLPDYLSSCPNWIKVIFSIFLCFSFIYVSGQEIHPFSKIETSGAITDFVIDGSYILISTDAGTIETYNPDIREKDDLIQLSDTKDFMGDPVPTKIYSIDKLSSKILAVTQGNHGFRNVLIFENGQSEEIITAERDKMIIKKARWVNNNTILLGLLSNDLILFDVMQKRIICEINISPYTFSDFSLTEDKQYAFTADESGIVHEIDLHNCVVKQDYMGINVDNIYQLVYKNGVIITAGQDRRVGVYNTITGDNYFLQKNFLVYSVGLNSDGSIGAYSATEENDISIFMTVNRKDVYILKGHQSVITKMVFIDDYTFLSAGDDQYLIIWKFK
jgi:WD40 repeat protein